MERLRPVEERQQLIYQHQQSNLPGLHVLMLPSVFTFDSKMSICHMCLGMSFNIIRILPIKTYFILRYQNKTLVQFVFVKFVLCWAWQDEGCLDSGEGSYSGLNIVWQTAKRTEWLLRKLVLWLQTFIYVDEDKLAYSAAKTRWQLLLWQTDIWNACVIRKWK